MQEDRLCDGRNKHNDNNGESLERTRGARLGKAIRTRSLIVRNVYQQPAKELGLKECQAILDKFEKTRNCVRSAIGSEKRYC